MIQAKRLNGFAIRLQEYRIHLTIWAKRFKKIRMRLTMWAKRLTQFRIRYPWFSYPLTGIYYSFKRLFLRLEKSTVRLSSSENV